MNYCKGDKVSLTGIVKHTPDEGKERIFIDIVGSHETLWMKPQDITLVQAAFEPGDLCTWKGFGDAQTDCATVLAISNGHAWIDMGGGAYCTRLLTAIERFNADDQG